jgi:hypothetical protein
MNRVLIVVALALTSLAAGCQTTIPKHNFPCTWRTADAGFCEQTSFNLVGRILER